MRRELCRIAARRALRAAMHRDCCRIAIRAASRQEENRCRASRLRCIAGLRRFALGQRGAAVRRLVGPLTPLPNGSEFCCRTLLLTNPKRYQPYRTVSADSSNSLLGGRPPRLLKQGQEGLCFLVEDPEESPDRDEATLCHSKATFGRGTST